MQFGTRKADAPERGNGVYLRRFSKGETKVRVIEEMDDWIEYFEHFTPDKKGFPCTQDRETCPGCTSENESVRKAGRKYATYLKLIKTGHVLPFAIPVSLADALARRAEKNNGSITNRDYAVMRSGDGFDTVYDVDQEDKYEIDLAAARAEVKVEIQDAFQEAFNEVWGSSDAKGSPSDVKDEHTPGDADPPTEPEAEQPAASGDEGVELTEAKVRAMDKGQLRDLCDTAGIDWDKTDTPKELADRLIEKFGS